MVGATGRSHEGGAEEVLPVTGEVRNGKRVGERWEDRSGEVGDRSGRDVPGGRFRVRSEERNPSRPVLPTTLGSPHLPSSEGGDRGPEREEGTKGDGPPT